VCAVCEQGEVPRTAHFASPSEVALRPIPPNHPVETHLGVPARNAHRKYRPEKTPRDIRTEATISQQKVPFFSLGVPVLQAVIVRDGLEKVSPFRRIQILVSELIHKDISQFAQLKRIDIKAQKAVQLEV